MQAIFYHVISPFVRWAVIANMLEYMITQKSSWCGTQQSNLLNRKTQVHLALKSYRQTGNVLATLTASFFPPLHYLATMSADSGSKVSYHLHTYFRSTCSLRVLIAAGLKDILLMYSQVDLAKAGKKIEQPSAVA